MACSPIYRPILSPAFRKTLRTGISITTARYLTPAGRDIQHHGIEPDVVINQDPNPSLIDTPADKQLAAAKARLAAELR